jgi:hypothetical protein
MRETRHFRVYFTITVTEKFEDLMNRGVVSGWFVIYVKGH